MRPQQQNRRMRGRNNGGGGNNNNNNNRKGPNPLTRSYESNGPDVKIRGSAQQIAEKYATLARDAQSSGDRVMAENYLQHAEHYNRIIAMAQAQLASQHVPVARDDIDDDIDDDYGFEQPHSGDGFGGQHGQGQQSQPQNGQGQQPVQGSGPQPVIEGTPAEVALTAQAPGQPYGGGRNRERRHQHQNGQPYGQAAAPINTPPEAQAPAVPQDESAPVAEAAPATPGEGESAFPPRRGRRPRRPRGERTQDGGTDGAPGTEGEEAMATAEG